MRGALLPITGCTVSPVEKEPVQQTPKIHRGWVALLASGGLVITSLAFAGRFTTGLSQDDLAVWQSILTNFGVGLLSAAVLLLFEPKFRRAVTDTVNTATAGVKEEVREAVQADLNERLASLTDRIDSLYDETIAAQQADIKDLATDFSYERVVKILRDADEIGALHDKSLRVQAEPDPWFLHIGLHLRIPDDVLHRYMEAGQAVPATEFEVLYLTASGDFGLQSDVEWEPNEDFSVAAIKLAKDLSRQHRRGLNQRIEWKSVLARFEKSIKIAIDSTNKTKDAIQLRGALVEVAGPDSAPWYLTTEGLHYPSRPWYCSRWKIVDPKTPLLMPEWADKSEWSYITHAALTLYQRK